MTGLVFAGYVAVFGVSALACVAGLSRVERVEDPDTRRGLAALLVTSGGWAAAQAGFLVVPSIQLKVAVYTAGLVFGIATVGAWLYFCSAYTGRAFHRDPTVRRAAVAVFLAVVAVKLTNPWHGFYFGVEQVSAPFPHVAIEHYVLHWVVMGTAYALAAVGYFMLFELLGQTGYDTRPLLALVGITGLPVAADVVGASTTLVPALSYESVGVAAFAVGVLFVYLDQFQAVQLAGDVEDAVVFLTEDDEIRDTNERARELFPALAGATGEPLDAVVPEVADRLAGNRDVVELGRNGERRFYQVSATPFTFGRTRVGRMVVVTDVTGEETARRRIERQNERLGRFASVVSHDLRNPLNVASGHVDLERETRDSEHLDAVARALDRMEQIIESVLLLAREGEDVGEYSRVSLATLAERAWSSVPAEHATHVVDTDLVFDADTDRVVQILENLYRNSVEHGGPEVAIRVGALDDSEGFYVEDDGPGIPAEHREDIFELGYTTGQGTGLGLSIVETIASAHGWGVSVTDAEHSETGARFEVRGVETAAE
ncbi:MULTISPECIES: ATP-binding protein [Halobacterium]|uniref:sensor histidine kinase n=1 Tax=Halobacterium TaxID=2239 RepID=UPI0009EB0E86|nr:MULTISPECIES: ATP-binding protein [Halobacterium]MCG1004277.1 ATP-binding protein [Halobacterium noricense]